MKVVVTGHRGYLGAALTPMLEAHGHEVTGIDVGYFDGCDFGPPAAPPAVDRTMDVRDVPEEVLEGKGAVIHLAALSNDPMGEIDPALTHAINTLGALSLAEKAKRAGVARFLFSSSCSLYGAQDGLVDERAPLRPLTAYARSKADTEEGLSRLADAHFCPVYLRNATAYGVSPRLRLDVVLNNLVGWALTTGVVRLSSDGGAFRPLVHVADIASLFLAALTAPREVVYDQAFNVGATEDNHRIADLAAMVAEVVPGARVERASGVSDHRSYRVDFGKVRRALSAFEPRFTVRSGALELLGAYRAYGLTAADMTGDRFIRLHRLMALRSDAKVP